MKRASVSTIVHAYLDRLHEIHGRRHTPELAYRAPLENLLNAVGELIDPPVQATAEIADTGSGHPDFEVYEAKSGNRRLVVEVKSPEEETTETANSSQVARYCKRYGLVLITNYRDFLLIGRSNGNGIGPLARCTLAGDPETFWRSRPTVLAKQMGEELADFLIGVMKRGAPIGRPRDLADDLARHAREARRRLERHDIAALEPLQKAMEQALGLHFSGKEGETFFRSSLVQTLFYGLFSGWMLWRQGRHRPGTFDWKDATDYLALPLIGDLYEEIARPRRLADLDLREPLEWATASLNSVVEEEFFKTFDQQHAITLFYEPFLQAFDPKLRKELGVWYTPPEIVQYMVGRVDQLLRSELGIADGLADDQVYVLDPAAGTGSYLVEVARRIHQTLTEQGHGALAAGRVKKALCTRIFGFEILPAPYVVSHLQLGVLLRSLGTNLTQKQRVGVYLTNSLTGWEPPKGAKQTLAFHFLEEEQEAAGKVKRDAPILVILGNPPYNAFAGVAQEEESDLIAPYYEGLRDYGVQVRGLNDLYIRFYRLAERRIAEVGGRGIFCYISNFSWLDGQSHPVMRKRLLDEFDQIWIDNCNGDKYRTGKRTPDGKPDQSMFTTDEQPIGIQVGTAVATFLRVNGKRRGGVQARVWYRDLWGYANDKRAALVQSLSPGKSGEGYRCLTPSRELRHVLTPGTTSGEYSLWQRLPDLFVHSYPGVQTCRDELVIDVDRERLDSRMVWYFDPSVSNEEIRQECPCAMTEGDGFPAATTRSRLMKRGFLRDKIVRFSYRPFDDRWLYWEPEEKLLDRKREDYFPQVWPENVSMTAAATIRKGDVEGPVPLAVLGCRHLIERGANIFPVFHRPPEDLHGPRVEPNIDAKILRATCRLFVTPFEPDALSVAKMLFYHILAILWSPAYRKENEAALRQDWPRVPIPADAKLLEASAALGRAVADLLLPDKSVVGVTTGKLRPELRPLAIPTKLGGRPIEEPADTKVEAGWGFRGQKNAVMCGKGSVVPCGEDREDAVNIYINEKVYWANVPNDVWAMTIGGYPVVKKWLSYREYKVLGRALKLDEITYVTEVVRRLKALLLMASDLDTNYRAAAAAPQIAAGAKPS